VRWQGRKLKQISLRKGSWSYDVLYEQRLAARWWNRTPAEWAALSLDDKAEMLAVYRTEVRREAVEMQDREREMNKLRR